jgi:hypothetical protein
LPGRKQTSPIDDLKARLAALFRHFAAALQQRQGDGPRLAEQFRKDLDLLIAQYGPEAVDAAALDETPDAELPPGSLH